LGWNEINSLCNRFGGEAVISVEIFDTDFIVTEGKRRVKKTVGSGDDRREVEVDEFFAEGVGNIKIGIRLYDKLNQRIIDEQLLNETNTWRSAANSKAQAIAQLINKSKATQELAKRVASNYAYKVAPMPVRLTRSYYKKSKKAPALNRGTRLADVNQWEEAIQAWQAGISTADEKRAGYLAYNIAVGYEVLGDFDTAISWAQKAYTNYGNKRARGYVNTLENRKFEEERVRDQMGNGN
jgi:tetratricopeptide (TPR) repeat protein